MSDSISRQAAIEALGERPIVWTDDDQYTLGERNQYDIDRLAIETLPSAQQWIPVSERLPEEGKDVLVCDAYGFIYTAECEVISDDEWLDWQWYESVEYMPKDDVVAWMPLPMPWRGDKDE